MTMTAYDIIAQLQMAPDQYLEARVFDPCHIGEDEFVILRVEPLRFMQEGKSFRVPNPDANQLANELNVIFAAARTLTA